MDHTVTETTRVYPRGRGKVLVISEKTLYKTKTKKPKKPSLTLFHCKSNPEPIKLKMYINNGRKRFVLFPEGRILQYDERLELASSLIASLKAETQTDGSFSILPTPITVIGKRKRHRSARGLFNKNLRDASFQKFFKIKNFVRKNNDI